MTLYLKHGEYALVDEEDYDKLSQYTWYLNPEGYATRADGKITIRMHRELLAAPKGKEVDHINMDRLDNRKSNLRLATKQQNSANRIVQKRNKTGYKGVHTRSDTGLYRARITFRGISQHIGYFKDPREAAKAYNATAVRLFGEYARLNDV